MTGKKGKEESNSTPLSVVEQLEETVAVLCCSAAVSTMSKLVYHLVEYSAVFQTCYRLYLSGL